MKKEKKRIILENILVTDYAAEGKALARQDGKVIFIRGAIPGDTVNILLTKNKKDWAEANVVEIISPAPDRIQPFCIHFGTCGGCKWQHLPYDKQLQFKQEEALQNLQRIGKVTLPPILPIQGADKTVEYRNKLEFTFSNKRFLTAIEMGNEASQNDQNALGFHVEKLYNKVLDISECFLMDDINNKIRNSLRNYCKENDLSFYDIKEHTGWLRNLIIRFTSTGELMVNLCMNYDDEKRVPLLDFLLKEIPSITTLLYTINPKWNDSIYDLSPVVYFGPGYIKERLHTGDGESLDFIISPKSFFQTNTGQAEKLYSIARDFAGLTGKEILYDLYCGTGSVGLFMSKKAGKVIGVEVIEEAVTDARKNAALNNIQHAHFFAGDVIRICNNEFFKEHGQPDVIITDPPRAGMHEKLVEKLLEISAPRIVYISCNTATQARDIALLGEKYTVEKIQPVDLFPHTHHIECVALLERKF